MHNFLLRNGIFEGLSLITFVVMGAVLFYFLDKILNKIFLGKAVYLKVMAKITVTAIIMKGILGYGLKIGMQEEYLGLFRILNYVSSVISFIGELLLAVILPIFFYHRNKASNKERPFTYDYSELIDKIESAIKTDALKKSDMLDIVRNTNIDMAGVGYHPIVNLYLPGDKENIYKPLISLYNRDNYSDKEWNDLVELKTTSIQQYEFDRQNFEKASVTDVLTEMYQYTNTLE